MTRRKVPPHGSTSPDTGNAQTGAIGAETYGRRHEHSGSHGAGNVNPNLYGAGRGTANDFGAGRNAHRGQRPSLDLTIGGRGDHFAGYIRFGNTRCDSDIRGAFLYHGNRHHRGSRSYYGSPQYFHSYRPLRYYGFDYYEPWYGYTYATAYYHTPYAYRAYDTDVYYIDQTYVQDDPLNVTVSSEVTTVETPAASDIVTVGEVATSDRVAVDETIPPQVTTPDTDLLPLTQPGEMTLVGKGNAAFTNGRYDDARRFYVSAIMADERDGYAKFLYALTNFALGDYQVASMAIRRALLTTVDLIDYPVDIRSFYPDKSSLTAQLDSLVAFVETHPQDADARLLLGYLHYAAGDPQLAMSVLEPLSTSGSKDEIASLLRDAALRVSRMNDSDE